MSFPTRGTWIETHCNSETFSDQLRRSLRGERGLKLIVCWPSDRAVGRSLRGERGLKHQHKNHGHGPDRRSLRGERGLKHAERREPETEGRVVPYAGNVD